MFFFFPFRFKPHILCDMKIYSSYAEFWNSFLIQGQYRKIQSIQAMMKTEKSFCRTLIRLFFTFPMTIPCSVFICGAWVLFWMQHKYKLVNQVGLVLNHRVFLYDWPVLSSLLKGSASSQWAWNTTARGIAQVSLEHPKLFGWLLRIL